MERADLPVARVRRGSAEEVLMAVVSLVERQAEPNLSVVEHLERLLSQARSGDIVNLATAHVAREGGSCHGWTEGPHATTLVGACTILTQKLSTSLC